MDFRVRSICLSQIDQTDQTFRITTTTDCIDLIPSIQTVGLLQPPLLLPKGDSYIIVCGFRRIAACQSLGVASIPARIERDRQPWGHYARIAIADNALQRPLNVVEQSRGLALIRRFANDSADWQSTATSVGLPIRRAAVDRLSKIADMPASLQMAIVEERIALPVALSITALESEDARRVTHLLRRINTGLNNQREILERIVELSIIESISISCLLERKEIARITDDDESPMPQLVQHLRQTLRKMRYPELSKAEDDYYHAVKALHLDSSIQLQPPPFFEGKTFRLIISIHSRRQLRSLLPELEKIANQLPRLPE